MARAPLDDVDFLVRSRHRVSVLETLAAGERTRADLHEMTGVSQPTLGRVLGDFEDRGWARRSGQLYALTPFGAVLADQLDELLGTVETMQRFREIAHYLPLSELPFDLRTFEDATVTLPRTADALAHVRRGEELVAGADSLRVLSPTIHPQLFDEVSDRLRAGDQRHEAVLQASALDAAFSDPTMTADVAGILDAEGVRVYRYDGSIPLPMGVADDRAFLLPLDEHGVPCALVETANETVRRWVADSFDEYRAEATLLTADDAPG